ncbi:hypothetical protein CsSME_00008211 [Camellia sinensis var. sinensis]|uniref:uncharacterized protein LOC114279153 isoform X1 n=1 Tax=Camellia sinensis TaxID=4442 RepID=UPI0010360FAE|nr:uncharacterized protein LOC114279153 isoform X1 [Camellia sinensis]
MSITCNCKLIPLHLSLLPNPNPKLPFPNPNPPPLSAPKLLSIRCAKRSQRTGKYRYPSEKKKLKSRQQTQIDVPQKFEGFWRLSKLGVSVHRDPGKDFLDVSDALLEEIAKVLEFPVASMLPPEAFSVVRKSFDARKSLKEPKFVYTVDMDVIKLLDLEPRTWDFISRLEPKVGLIEHMLDERVSGDIINVIHDYRRIYNGVVSNEGGHIQLGESFKYPATKKPKVGVVGSGPSGLFASLVLAELGADVTLIERGQAVEQRGRDIGALVVRRILQLESNFCFGEGGAGTWSDGKLVTRIGRNSCSVLAVMKTLVHFGAPKNILVDGKPHLGTDRLVPLLRNFRRHLQGLGVNIRFGTRVDDLLVENRSVVGVKISDSSNDLKFDSQKLGCDAVVLAVGHSARDIYQMLLSHDMNLCPKDFSVGLRIEHPQELINSIQYSGLATEVRSGRGKVPVADYKVVKYIKGDDVDTTFNPGTVRRGCYSFCMCPGGQVVLTSTNPSELCINGMSFSRRASKWANAALVVTVSSKDFDALNFHGPLAGVEFQREFERRAATMGGGNFVVPVQTVTDFLENKLSGASVPPSSYRLGVKVASLHELFPNNITEALQNSLSMFDKELPGFISNNALLHGVETRTSSPVQIPRNTDTYESTSLKGLYPVGEGAGYAGGIVSAAVDGMYAGFAVAKNLDLYRGSIDSLLGKAQNPSFTNY